MLDLLLKGGMLVDGTGQGAFLGNIGIQGDTITYMGSGTPEAGEEVDCTGLTVCPGFIDAHAHDDVALYAQPLNSNKLLQGITTCINGNCGAGVLPIPEVGFEAIRGQMGTPGIPLPPNMGSFTDFTRFAQDADTFPLGTNTAMMIGHMNLRLAGAGLAHFNDPHLTDETLERMGRLLGCCLEQGAAGLSFYLIAYPGVIAPRDELLSLCRVSAKHGKPFSVHMRSEGDGIEEAVREVVSLARFSGCAAQISHFKVSGSDNRGKEDAVLRMVEQAVDEGIDISLDMYPYTAGCNALDAVLPPALAAEGAEAVRSCLSDAARRRELAHEMETSKDYENLYRLSGPENILLLFNELEGVTVAQLAEETGKKPTDALFDLLLEDDGIKVAFFQNSEQAVEMGIRSPLVMFGTDGINVPPGESTHPRTTSAFPLVLGEYVRRRKLISLETAIYKMTGMAARKFNLTDRGVLREGAKADITLFDPDTIDAGGDYFDCYRENSGIHSVYVNGVPTVLDGGFTGRTAGRILRV